MESHTDVRRGLTCDVFPLHSFETYKYVVVCARYNGMWLFSKHQSRDTWETQGGHIEPGETPLEAARRELFEESGVTEADITAVCDYCGTDACSSSAGMVFFADVKARGPLPASEMRAARLFAKLPRQLTYPAVTPVLIAQAEKLCAGADRRE